jgi:hypothetical protein
MKFSLQLQHFPNTIWIQLKCLWYLTEGIAPFWSKFRSNAVSRTMRPWPGPPKSTGTMIWQRYWHWHRITIWLTSVEQRERTYWILWRIWQSHCWGRTKVLKDAQTFNVTAKLTKPSQSIIVLIASVRQCRPSHLDGEPEYLRRSRSRALWSNIRLDLRFYHKSILHSILDLCHRW